MEIHKLIFVLTSSWHLSWHLCKEENTFSKVLAISNNHSQVSILQQDGSEQKSPALNEFILLKLRMFNVHDWTSGSAKQKEYNKIQ